MHFSQGKVSQGKARYSVSTWSLHRELGDPGLYGPDLGDKVPEFGYERGQLSLLELPEKIAQFGIHTLEIVHFHLPSRDLAYLDELRAAIENANVELFSLLIDSGDITDPNEGERHKDWIAGWLEVAHHLGSRHARVVAGKQEPRKETIALSIERLSELADRAEALGLRLMTENWLTLANSPEVVTQLMEGLEGRVGLCFDFGNWRGEEKYRQLEQIAQYAESCHTKGFFYNGILDKDDYVKCLEITKQAGFSGPYTLIFDSEKPGEWEGLKTEMAVVEHYLG
ncbi:MAG: sugar phosphate isomerase/epimerase [Trueperaceae bacterium]|nr:sugar phosphate isomerase/epimerase [Trueperaceae bacterium]